MSEQLRRVLASVGLAAAVAVTSDIPALGADGVAPPSSLSCREFLALGPEAAAGGGTWNAAAVQRLFYVAYAMGAVNAVSPGRLEAQGKGAEVKMTPDGFFQGSILTVDRSLTTICELDGPKSLGEALEFYKRR